MIQNPGPTLTAEDYSYRHAAEKYFEEKGRIAEASFDGDLLRVFRDFQDHWQEFFAPPGPKEQLTYLANPFELRKAKFERFKRECRAWEISFRLYAKAPARNRAASPEMSDLRRRLDEQRTKTERVRAFYDNLDTLLDKERQRRSHPMELMVHLRALELPADATLDDIKKQYKRLARVHHPDFSGDALMMSKLSDAYRAILNFYKVA